MNNSDNFLIAFNFIKALFVKVFSTLDNIFIFGSFSILDFNISLLLFGAILPVVIITVKNWSSTSRYDSLIEKRNSSKSSNSSETSLTLR